MERILQGSPPCVQHLKLLHTLGFAYVVVFFNSDWNWVQCKILQYIFIWMHIWGHYRDECFNWRHILTSWKSPLLLNFQVYLGGDLRSLSHLKTRLRSNCNLLQRKLSDYSFDLLMCISLKSLSSSKFLRGQNCNLLARANVLRLFWICMAWGGEILDGVGWGNTVNSSEWWISISIYLNIWIWAQFHRVLLKGGAGRGAPPTSN